MGKAYRWALISAAAAAVLAAILYLRADRGPNIQVVTAAVTNGPITRHVLVTGTLEPARMVEVGSQVSGTIGSLNVDFNSPVSAGQVLARLEPAAFHARLTEAEAGLAKARAERATRQALLDDVRRKFDRAKALAGDQQLARAELDLAQTARQQAEADVRGAEAGIAAAAAAVTEARVSLERTVIRSPIDGVVIGRHVDVGQTIAASVNAPVLFTIGDLRRMRLLAEVPEGEVGGLQPGSQVRFAIESIGTHDFTGTVAEVRLDPLVQQAAAAGANTGSTPAAAATSGSSSNAAAPAASRPSAASASASTSPAQPSATAASPPAPAGGASSGQTAVATTGVVTYIAVIDVDTASQHVPPGGTAVVTLAGAERPRAVRIPNNAMTFAPPEPVLAEIDQKAPILDQQDRGPSARSPARKGYVWKFENGRFVPIAIETGIADEAWTELVKGDVRPGDRLVTAAAPRSR